MRLETALQMPGARDNELNRGLALEAAGGLAYWQGDVDATQVFYDEALVLARASSDPARLANALYNASFPFSVSQRDLLKARSLLDEALAIYRRLGDDRGYAQCLWALSQAFFRSNENEAAVEPLDEAIHLFRRLGDHFGLGWALFVRGTLALRMHDVATAKARNLEALEIFVEADDLSAPVLVLAGLAAVAREEGDVLRAMRLSGASEAQEAVTGTGLGSLVGTQELWRPSGDLSPEEEAARAEGRAMSLEQAIDYALSADSDQHHLVGRI